MNWRERAVIFPCEDEQLVGVLTTPDSTERATDIGVLVVVGGPQYRVGAHRQFVQLARALAAGGHTVLRFDVRGMGDSSGLQRPFDHLEPDVGAALDAAHLAAPAVKRWVLMGLCDGASAAWMYLGKTLDQRVAAVCAANPWVRSDATLAKTQLKHYYIDRLKQPEFWRKLVSGRIGSEALMAILRNMQLAWRGGRARNGGEASLPFQVRMTRGCTSFGGPQLIVLSEADMTAQEFGEQLQSNPAWAEAVRRPEVQVQRVPDADHTFSQAAARRRFEELVLAWLGQWSAPERANGGRA